MPEPQQPKSENTSTGTSPVVVIGSIGVVAILGWILFGTAPAPDARASMPEPPSLLEPDVLEPSGRGAQTRCPDATAAAARAREVEHAALAKAQRYHFVAHDGVEAVSLFKTARACYEISNDAASATRVSAAIQRWSRRLESDYGSHRLRLRLALDRGAETEVLHEIEALKALLHGRTDPYVSWLERLARSLSH